MRDAEGKRLIELLSNQFAELVRDGDWGFEDMLANVADHLLENGVIVPPCTVGTPLYMIVEKRASVTKEYFTLIKKTKLTFGNMERVIEGFGKTVFLSEEEAEYALKNRRSVSLVNGHIEE